MSDFKCPMCSDCPDNCPLDVQKIDTRKCTAEWNMGYEQGKIDRDKEIAEHNVFFSNKPIEDIVLDARADEREKTIDECIEYFEIHANEVWQHVSARDFICDRLEMLKEQKNV